MCHSDKTYPADFILGRKTPESAEKAKKSPQPPKETEELLANMPQ